MTNKPSYEELESRLKSSEEIRLEQEKTINTYQAMFNSASDAVFIHHIPNGRIVEANQKAQEIFGFTEEEFLQMDVTFISQGNSNSDRAEKSAQAAALPEGENLLFEWRCRKKDGSLFWVEVNLKKIIFHDQEMMISIVRDISKRKEAEKEFKRVEQLSKAIQHLGKVGAWELDIASQTSFWTDEVYRIHDLEPDSSVHAVKYLTEKSLPCFHSNDRQILIDALNKCVEKGTPFNLEFPFTSVKGRKLWVQTEARRVESEKKGGRVIGYFRDITALKNQEEELRTKEIRYKTILQTAVDGFLLTDLKGRILEVNNAYCRMSGYSEKELLFLRIPDLEGCMASEEVAARIEKVKKGRSDRFETKHRRKDGTAYDVEISVTYLPGEGGRLVNFARDISAFKASEKKRSELQDQLSQIQKMESIGRLAGGVAHDLNNLLAPVLGYTEMLMENKKGRTSRQDKLSSIYKAVIRAKNLVGQLLAFSRKQTLDFRFLDVDKVLLAFRTLLRRTIREDIRLNITPSPGVKGVMADQTQLEQIIMNLTVNAADAMPDGGMLTIETSVTLLDESYASKRPGVEPGKYVLMCFTDTGHGMEKEMCRRIFEPFYSTKGTKGTGLGLATVYGIVKQHKGNIWVYSEIGKGSVFKVYLPYKPGRESKPEITKAPVHDLKGRETILLAEDNEGVRNLAADILVQNGYTVFAAENGNEAIEMWASIDDAVDLLVTDVIMPEMNGRELYASLNGLDQNIRVLYMSGYPDNAIAHHGVLDHDVNYIQKPFSTDDFLLKVRQVLDK